MKMRLILILLTPLFLMTFFQNCMKKPNGEVSSLQACLDSGGGSACGLVAANGIRVAIDPVGTKLNLNSLYNGANAYSVDVDSDVVTNTSTGASCSLSGNSNWQQLKDLYLKNGICEYRYELPPGMVRCMAYPMPFASVYNSNLENEIHLSGSVCQTDHYHICGQENQQPFQNSIRDLEQQISNNTACD
jgi:hypothetical protein